MAQITKEITVDVAKKNLFQAIVAKQNDSNSRFLNVTLTNEGSTITVEQSSSVLINSERADGSAEAFAGTVNADGTVTVPLTSWMLEYDDIVRCDISIIDASSRKLTSTSFTIEVEAAAFSGEDISNDENYDILITLLGECADTKSACDTATAAANTAAARAEQAAARAEQAASAIFDELTANDTSYDNTVSGLEGDTVQEALDEMSATLRNLAGITVDVSTWENVQQAVRSGFAKNVFHIGDQLVCGHSRLGNLTWDVIGIDCDTPTDTTKTHSLTLQLHDCLAGLQFDGVEALYYAATSLAAGTYNFSIVTQPWYTADNGKTFQFTLTQAVPVGGQIVLEMTYNQALAGKSVKTYVDRTTTTPIETAIISEGNGGTALGATDGSVTNLNHIQRAIMGSNNYANSAMRQFLLSDAAAGSVWTPKTNFDRPPSWATSQAGFLNGIDEDFLAVIGDVNKVTTKNTVTDGGGSTTTEEKIFLLSRSEIYGGNENSISEGAAYPYYCDNSDLAAAGAGADSNRIKYRNGSAQYWWLRSPYTSYAYGVRYVYTTGDVTSNYAYIGHGVAPACCII